MAIAILMIIIIILFSFWMLFLFLEWAIMGIVNFLLLIVIILREYADLHTRKYLAYYVIGAAVGWLALFSGIADLLSRLQVLLPVQFLLVAFVVAQILIFIDKKYMQPKIP
ncbi:hypothetical protein GOV09_05315 [Candidatus Woesearchaeota archaeon]|nr:hypothetical protein [Candidatus Woesearchaeota archaeon]